MRPAAGEGEQRAGDHPHRPRGGGGQGQGPGAGGGRLYHQALLHAGADGPRQGQHPPHRHEPERPGGGGHGRRGRPDHQPGELSGLQARQARGSDPAGI